MNASIKRIYRILGPGILFAAAAIGVSHLVQSTRAGALYGLSMIPILLIACVAKYPSLLFGLLYPAATGKTLLQSYRQQGWWALGLFIAIAVYAMWFVLAAIAITTAGLLQALLGWPDSTNLATAIVIGMALVVLLGGRYQGLEHVSKWLLGLLAILLPIATLLVLPQVDSSFEAWVLPELDIPTLAFIIALTGWMPIPIDASVVSSTWAASRNEASGTRTSARDASLDFNVGYGLAILFALCFVILGAGVLHTSGTTPPNGAGPFAAMVIELFTSQLGDWSFYLIGAVAFVTMFTTLLTVLDGQVRVVSYALQLLRPGLIEPAKIYAPGLLLYAIGGFTVVYFFMQSFTSFINFVTSLGFLIAPVVVVLNHRAMFGKEIDAQQQPRRHLYWWSIAGGVVLCGASIVYFYVALFS
jgi:Mn2+/Fe2+ NRAMP family transporter